MPSRWEIHLAGAAGAAVPLAAPQAVVSGWLDDRSPRGTPGGGARPGRSGHGDQARKWACGPLQSDAGAGAGIVLQVRLLDDGLADRLHAAVQPGKVVRLGAHHYEIAGEPRLAGRASWQELRRWSGARAWQMRFITPACFRRGDRTSPWPAPESVWRGLADRWRQLHPDTAPLTAGPGAGPVWVSDVDGRSEVVTLTRNVRRDGQWRLSDEVVSGFTGRIRYVCDQGSDEEAAAFSAIMALAPFAGAGSHTTYGFGVVVPEPTWQPPTTRPAER